MSLNQPTPHGAPPHGYPPPFAPPQPGATPFGAPPPPSLPYAMPSYAAPPHSAPPYAQQPYVAPQQFGQPPHAPQPYGAQPQYAQPAYAPQYPPPPPPLAQYAAPQYAPPPPPPQYAVPQYVAPQPMPQRVEPQLPPLPSLPLPPRPATALQPLVSKGPPAEPSAAASPAVARTPTPPRPPRSKVRAKPKLDAKREPRAEIKPPPLPKTSPTFVAVPIAEIDAAAALAAEEREELENRQRALIAGFVSMIVHLMLLITLGLMVAAPKNQQYGGITLEASVEKIDEDLIGKEARIDLTKPETVDAGRPIGLPTLASLPNMMPGTVGMAPIGAPIAPPTFSGAPIGAGGGEGQGDGMLGGGLPAHTKPGDGNGATFFDIPATGRKIAFVVDTSGSMYDNDRYLRCRKELIESLRTLKPKQFYFIVLFSDRLFPMPGRRLTEATPGNLYRTIAWLNTADPTGTTEPVPALKQALQQRPDAIFLLTDGSFEEGALEKILKLQPASKKVPIHTIAFEGQEGEEALKQISRATGGKYRYVP